MLHIFIRLRGLGEVYLKKLISIKVKCSRNSFSKERIKLFMKTSYILFHCVLGTCIVELSCFGSTIKTGLYF